MNDTLNVSLVNAYLAHKQHVLPASRWADVMQVTRDIVALHATNPAGPYLALWARVPDFRREMLDDALYEKRTLAKVLCMRVTLHVVPSDEVPRVVRACGDQAEGRTPPQFRGAGLLVQAGVCPADAPRAEAVLESLRRRVLGVLAEQGPSTLQEISQHVPELKAKIRHSEGKAYEGEFSVGTRLMGEWCAQGVLIRARPRGTWRSSLYEYAAFSDWLPGVNLASVVPRDARAGLVRCYLAAFGPATLDDVQWWTGFSKGETEEALETVDSAVVEVSIEGLGDRFLMLTDDARRLDDFTPPANPYVFFLPDLDPYVMGYKDRRRFLAPKHRDKVFDRAGNAVPTVWANGRLVGVWSQRKDSSVVYGLFEPVGDEERALLDAEARRLEGFLAGDVVSPRFFRTPFHKALEGGLA